MSGKRESYQFRCQLEIFCKDEWKVAIRYDSAHGYSHIDKFYRNGRSVKKELHLNLKEALTLADEDIKDNWKVYRKAFIMEDK